MTDERDTLRLAMPDPKTDLERFLEAYNNSMKLYAESRNADAYHHAQDIFESFMRRYASLPPMTYEIVKAYEAVEAADDIDKPGLSENEYLALRRAVGEAIKNGRR